MEKITLIVAGGSGKRMNAGVPKQFLTLCGIPVLMHTLQVFRKFDPRMRIILALPGNQLLTWHQLCRQYECTVEHEIAQGGKTRFHTVRNCMDIIPDNCLVAVHDGVRPLVSLETIGRCFDTARKLGNAVPCIEIPETLRKITAKGNIRADRARFRLIQTPQVFDSGILRKGYLQKYRKRYTDDAGVVEDMGYPINLVDGNPENIKITYEKDLKMAASLLE